MFQNIHQQNMSIPNCLPLSLSLNNLHYIQLTMAHLVSVSFNVIYSMIFLGYGTLHSLVSALSYSISTDHVIGKTRGQYLATIGVI